jgi:maltose alpha-D-glucosyltransferase/alpha-amylase
MGFHFPVMPRLFMALRKADRTPLVWILGRTPPIPDNCQWCTFLRNHDELTLEMVTEEERQWMWQEYAPEPRMRLNLGIRRRLAPLLDNDRRKIGLANSLLFTLPGSSILYYGDEIGMGDNIWMPDRNGVRTPMQWTSAVNAGFSTAAPKSLYLPVIDNSVYGPGHVNVADERAHPDSLLNTLRHMIAVRKQHPSFGRGSFAWAECESLAIAAYVRQYGDDRVLVVNNLSSKPQAVTLKAPLASSGGEPQDLLGMQILPAMEDGTLTLELKPYQYLWIKV